MSLREAVGAVLCSEGKVCIVYKVGASNGSRIKPFWGLPVGGVDGEEHSVALVREVKEETGIDISPPFEACGSLEYVIHDGRTQHVTLYLVHVVGLPKILPRDTHEIDKGGWFSPQKAYEKISHDGSKRVIEELFL